MSEQITTLDQLGVGDSGIIKKVGGKGALRRRLLDMGLTSGAPVEMVRSSPLGDPIEYKVRGYRLSLRKSEAITIEVEI
jgi:Fe2+ transport system protein FeoA